MPCNDNHDEREAKCTECGLFVDQYGNTEDDFRNCCFPDCGCDGARLCMAPSGANVASACMNLEKGTSVYNFGGLKKSPENLISAADARLEVAHFKGGTGDNCAHVWRNTRDKNNIAFQRCSKCWRRRT